MTARGGMAVAREDLILVEATPKLRDAFLDMAQEFSAAGDDRYAEAARDFDAFVQRCRDGSHGVGLRPGIVPWTELWLVRDGRRVLAVSHLRHHLTPELERFGGHIGCAVRPSERRKGYGTKLLALTLEKARARGLTRVLVTCDDDNVSSARIIEKNGGVQDTMSTNPRSGKPSRRYWIDL
jgi:predicted acetyltransferase